MDTASKRTVRLVMIMIVVALLTTALVYTSFSASSETRTPSSLIDGNDPGENVRLAGTIVRGSATRDGETLRFRVSDTGGGKSVPVKYVGAVPDPFKDDGTREAIVSGRYRGGVFHADRDSLVTKCPSKFKKKEERKKSSKKA